MIMVKIMEVIIFLFVILISSVSDDEVEKKKTFIKPLFIVQKCEKNERNDKNKNN